MSANSKNPFVEVFDFGFDHLYILLIGSMETYNYSLELSWCSGVCGGDACRHVAGYYIA